MTYASPVRMEKEVQNQSNHSHHGAEPFSRWQHFAMAMVPMVLAEMYIQGRDRWAFSMVAVFVFSLASVIAMLRALNRLEDWEAKNQRK